MNHPDNEANVSFPDWIHLGDDAKSRLDKGEQQENQSKACCQECYSPSDGEREEYQD
jgi:hypothetical protein